MRKKKIIQIICAALMAATMSGCGILDELLSDETVEDKTEEVEVVGTGDVIANSVGETFPREEVDEIVVVDTDGNVIEGADGAGENISMDTNDGSAQGYFKAYDINGNEVTQEIFTKSKLTVVNMWATFCSPCIEEMPSLGELSREYDEADVRFIGVVSDADASNANQVMAIIDETGADYMHLYLNSDLAEWKFDEFQYVPTTLFVDSNGMILDYTVGSNSKAAWKRQINSYR